MHHYHGDYIRRVDDLPPASSDYRGMPLRLSGGAGSPDRVVICVKGADNAYTWTQIGGLVVNALDHALVGDGVTDNTAAAATMVAAVAAAGGGTIVFPPGDYHFATTGTALAVTSSNVRLAAQPGATISAPDADYIIRAYGSTAYDVATVTADITAGDTTITVDDANGLAVGGDIVIRSEGEIFNPGRGLQDTVAQWARIAGIAGTTVTLEAPVRYDFDATTYTVRVDVQTMLENIAVDGLTIQGGGSGTQYGVFLLNVRNAQVSNVVVHDCPTNGILVSRVLGGSVTGCHVTDCNATGLGYGVLVNASEGVTVIACYGERNRHSFDVSGHGGLAANGGSRDPIAHGITFSGNIAKFDDAAGISTHCADMVTITGNHVSGCGGGIIIRSTNTTVSDNTIDGTYHAASGDSTLYPIWIGETGGTGRSEAFAGRNLHISGNRLNAIADAVIANRRAIQVYGPLDNAIITDNIITGTSTLTINVVGHWNDRVLISGNVLVGAGAASSSAIRFDPNTLAEGNNHKRITICDNIISGYETPIRFRCTSPIDPSSDLVVQGNTITGAYIAVQATDCDAKRIAVTGNAMPDTDRTRQLLLGTQLQDTPVVTGNQHNGAVGFGIVGMGSAAPASGTYRRGDAVLNESPAAAGDWGWVCVTGGSPGTWKAFGTIAP